jgi:pimeloyl-ACP methyl ester carboxylesterase
MRRSIGNLTLNVEERGSGNPSLVFLHYWGGSARTWNKVIDRLQPSFHCIAYDMRGWGSSDAPKAGYCVSHLADDAAALIDSLALTQYVLVGHSMGGKIAQLLASRSPAGLEALILVAPASPSPVHFPPEAREQQIHAYDNRENALQAIAFLSARTPAPEIVEQIVEDNLGGSAPGKLTWPTYGILEDISTELRKISLPTLLLAGELDRLDSIEQHRREILTRIPNARLEIIHNSGHLVPIDEPVQLASAIAQFVEQLPN